MVLKIKPKKNVPKPSYWYCDVCKKNYAIKGKYQHLKTEMHKSNLKNPSPGGHQHLNPLPRVRRCKNPEDYVENKLIKSFAENTLNNLFVGGNILDDPISDTNLPEPLTPTKYKPKRPVPKPRSRLRAPIALPRSPIRKMPTALQKKVKRLIDEISPYYKPETISEFKRKLKFIPKDDDVIIKEKSKALKGNVKSYEVSIVNSYDPSVQLNSTRIATIKFLIELLSITRGFKFNSTLKVRLSKRTENGTIYREPYFNAGPYTVTNSDSISESINNAIERILELIAGWLSEGSGWIFELVLLHNINIVSYFPLKGNSYIKLPEELRNPKKTLVNPKNVDNRCFLWCHNRYLNPLKVHPERITKADREYVKRLDYTGVTFPVTIKDIDKIEKQNQINVNVFGYDKGAYPIRISKAKFKDHLELLWIEEKENSHYVLIKNFNQFMTSFTKHKDRKYFCMSCLHCCSSERTLEMHRQDCLAINGTQAIRMPEEGSKIYFQNHQKMLPAPFTIYADFEAITEKNRRLPA